MTEYRWGGRGVPNLDAWGRGELSRFVSSVTIRGRKGAEEVAGWVFPELMAGNRRSQDQAVAAVRKLASYAKLRFRAILLRWQGRIDKALQMERKMDDIYDALPAWARW